MSKFDNGQPTRNCSDPRECFQMLQLILDGEATHEQKEHFKAHIEDCMPCFQNYHLDMAIRDLLKLKCSSQAPADLIATIKSKIQNKAVH